ncbi:hypothetical protein DWV00_32490 [Trinickia dinghuensis]|uniref:Uncharacterized protein n=2 Tax=Trinickia dinghuensis TaxID=2291023 RepID=A0A3D8JQA4_9BURK|nr:hypothetical protein DWV00_32490 [Trinickia dinghuensis]
MRKEKPFGRPTLRLRGDAHRVEIIVPNGTTQPVMGTREPGDEDARAATIEHAGGAGRSPRQEVPVSIEQPLPQRVQTVLTHRLPRAVQERLDGGGESLASSRRADRGGEIELLSAADLEDRGYGKTK